MRRIFQVYFAADGAAGAGAGAGTVDEKAAAAAAQKVTDDKAAADKVVADAAAKKTADDTAAAEKVAADKKTADDAAAADAAKSKAPEKYELKVEKDAATFIDKDDIAMVEAFARDKGLTNDQAQSILNDRANALSAQSAKFREVTEADKDLGGDNLVETQRLVKVALDKIYPTGTKDGDEFRSMLSKTGYGNNRLIVKHFRNLGRQIAEDSPGAEGATRSTTPQDQGAKLYDHPTSKL